MSKSPASRTIKLLRDMGMEADSAERWIAQARVRRDLFGFIDIVALDEKNSMTIGVQTTTVSNVASRIAKIMAEPRAKLWARCGNRILVVGWSKKGARGERKVWRPRLVWIDPKATDIVS